MSPPAGGRGRADAAHHRRAGRKIILEFFKNQSMSENKSWKSKIDDCKKSKND